MEQDQVFNSSLKKGLKPWLGRKHSAKSIEKMCKSQQEAHKRIKEEAKILFDLSKGGPQAGMGGQPLGGGEMGPSSLP